jgi:hypothetical protein
MLLNREDGIVAGEGLDAQQRAPDRSTCCWSP